MKNIFPVLIQIGILITSTHKARIFLLVDLRDFFFRFRAGDENK